MGIGLYQQAPQDTCHLRTDLNMSQYYNLLSSKILMGSMNQLDMQYKLTPSLHQ